MNIFTFWWVYPIFACLCILLLIFLLAKKVKQEPKEEGPRYRLVERAYDNGVTHYQIQNKLYGKWNDFGGYYHNKVLALKALNMINVTPPSVVKEEVIG